MTEYRREQRYMLRVAATLKVAGGPERVCLVNDISPGGLGLVSNEPLERGTVVQLGVFGRTDELEDRRSEPLALHGRVTWCSERGHHSHRVGVRFEKLGPELERSLDRILDALAGIE